MSLDFLLLLLLELGDVEALVDHLGDGADLRAELVLDSVQGEAVVVRNEVKGNPRWPKRPDRPMRWR